MPQPMDSGSGCILSVSLSIAGDLAALVIPVATSDTGGNGDGTAYHAVRAFDSELLSLLCAAMTTNCWVRGVSGTPMDNGFLPWSKGYSSATAPGTISGGCVSAETGALVTYYPYSADRIVGDRLRHSRMIVPGVAISGLTVSGQINLSNAYYTALAAFANKLVDGFTDTDGSFTYTFYRVLAAPPPKTKGGLPNTALVRLETTPRVQNNLGVQRRRILPH